jgi:hypothetical protein
MICLSKTMQLPEVHEEVQRHQWLGLVRSSQASFDGALVLWEGVAHGLVFISIFLQALICRLHETFHHQPMDRTFLQQQGSAKNQVVIAVGQQGYWTLICSCTALWGLIVLPRQNGKLGTHNCHNQCSSGHTNQC